eukprot:1157056-Pelagomonas_calceolata.AAC.6
MWKLVDPLLLLTGPVKPGQWRFLTSLKGLMDETVLRGVFWEIHVRKHFGACLAAPLPGLFCNSMLTEAQLYITFGTGHNDVALPESASEAMRVEYDSYYMREKEMEDYKL